MHIEYVSGHEYVVYSRASLEVSIPARKEETMYLQVRRLVELVVAVVLIGAIPGTARATVHVIQVGDFFFDPPGTVVAPGDTVRWVLQAGVHQVSSDTGSAKGWESDTLSMPGDSFETVFTFADGIGPFSYRCTLHPGMRDTIFVATTCWATGSLSDSPVPLVSDMVYAVRMLSGFAPPPDALYRFDLTGDCVVDTADINLLNCFFIQGLSCFDQHPVPTCCFPVLVTSDCPVPITGDVNSDYRLSTADIIATLGFIWKGLPMPHPCLAVADVNCSGSTTSADIIYLVQFMFRGGPEPCDVCTLYPDDWDCQ